LHGLLVVEGEPASKRILSLSRWIDVLDSRDHLFVRALQPFSLWREQAAFGVEHWRVNNRAYVANWLSAVAEFEALSSLAALAFERPDWIFPSLVDSGTAVFSAKAIRHPLLPSARSIPNDIGFDPPLRLWIISGSNMSGKSTLLRAIGLNTVLAWAGAPVPAARLELSELQLGASLRVSDSLQDNRSRFMAEITRIRDIVALSRAGAPVLFLLDELLSGTNSHDRLIGSSSIVQGLVAAGGIGFVTTHDLALAAIERDLGQRAANAHFEDAIIDGEIVFDYVLRPGIVTRSNALALMRAVGLEV
jgi:DNA mismatch repair ATPase MutS